MSGVDLPPAAYALALASLPGCTHERLRRILQAASFDAGKAWAALVEPSRRGSELDLNLDETLHLDLGSTVGMFDADLVARWRLAGRRADVAARWQAARAAGIDVRLFGGDGYPVSLLDDPDPPPVLFSLGAGPPAAVGGSGRPAVAIVGTRRCTAYGADVARDLGRQLSAAGVSVVSGLALGIDGAAHEGALAAGGAPPVAVVGSGLDVVYPPRHRALWQRVAEAGLILSEAPPGASPEPWRFPRRNRILAGLAEVVVVVESHASGGSLSTVRAATERGITVMAVPGSIRSPSSAGTNRLLADGVAPVTDAQDVLVALALEGAVTAPAPPPRGVEDAVLDAVDWTPTATEDVLRRTGLGVAEAATRLTRLEAQGLLRRRGAWWERVAPPDPATHGGYTATT